MDAKKKTFIEALHSNFGNVTKACESCGVSRFWYYSHIKEDEEFKSHCENIDEYIIDTVENHLFQQIKDNNTTATIFFLKTKGKKRGYTEERINNENETLKNNIIDLFTLVKNDSKSES